MGMNIEYYGLKLKIEEGVYKPSDDTYLLAENLKVKTGDIVLEIGTGSGLISLIAAKKAEKVVATDISPLAIELARYNIELNSLVEKIEVRQGNLFDPIREGENFDIILFNPPYLPEDPSSEQKVQDWDEKTWNGGRYGRKFIDPFIKECKRFLKKSGGVQMIQSSLSNIDKTRSSFESLGFLVEINTQASFFFEKIVLVNAWLK